MNDNDLTFTTPLPVETPLWHDIRDQKALADMARLQKEAEAARQRLQNQPIEVDPLTAANNRILTLEARVRELEAELLSRPAPHLRGREVR